MAWRGTLCGWSQLNAGAAFASYLLSPLNTVSVGASGAIFGLFVVSVLTRLQLNLRSLLVSVYVGVSTCWLGMVKAGLLTGAVVAFPQCLSM